MSSRIPALERLLMELQKAVGRAAYASGSRLGSEELRVVAGVDAAYGGGFMAAAAVSWSLESREIVDEAIHVCEPPYPYIPGLLFLREGAPMLEAVKRLGDGWQLLLVDAHGVLHPRRAGLAVFLGFILDRPTLGVAKRLLVGVEEGEGEVREVRLDGEVLGYGFHPPSSRKFYVSPGYGVAVEEVPRIISDMGGGYPEALREADRLSREKIGEILGSR